MKKQLQPIIALVLVIIALAFSSFVESSYTREAKVCSVKNGVTAFEDKTGNIWEYETTDFEYDSEVILFMNTNHTDNNIYDDIIIKPIVK